MGNFLLLAAAVWMLLWAGHGTAAARVKLQSSIKETSLLPQRSLGQISPLDNGSGSGKRYLAQHLSGTSDQGFYGIIATMDVYGFNLTTEQFTEGSVLLHDEDGSNIIQIGWEVAPDTYGDSRTHLGSLWTTDGYRKTSCRNAECAFLPEKDAPIALGGVIETVTQPNGPKQTITIKVIKDGIMGDWLVYYGFNGGDPALIGRFPKSLFTGGLANRAALIQFGGYVWTNTITPPPMGSGYLPKDDAATSASMSNIQFIDQNGHPYPVPQDSPTYVTDPNIYATNPIVNGRFFYGGPMQ
ncbi:uncharacterized protein [Lolium perenne]|uniref:uncharacterized protein n=1 Tax=Lolium perenne TaxID=4522 RepID=UPI0021F67F4D|nr:uncharacterized protein LOC127315247 [Lolium perenne]